MAAVTGTGTPAGPDKLSGGHENQQRWRRGPHSIGAGLSFVRRAAHKFHGIFLAPAIATHGLRPLVGRAQGRPRPSTSSPPPDEPTQGALAIISQGEEGRLRELLLHD